MSDLTLEIIRKILDEPEKPLESLSTPEDFTDGLGPIVKVPIPVLGPQIIDPETLKKASIIIPYATRGENRNTFKRAVLRSSMMSTTLISEYFSGRGAIIMANLDVLYDVTSSADHPYRFAVWNDYDEGFWDDHKAVGSLYGYKGRKSGDINESMTEYILWKTTRSIALKLLYSNGVKQSVTMVKGYGSKGLGKWSFKGWRKDIFAISKRFEDLGESAKLIDVPYQDKVTKRIKKDPVDLFVIGIPALDVRRMKHEEIYLFNHSVGGIRVAIEVLRKNGTLIFPIGGLMNVTESLIGLLSSCFEKVWIIKPLSSIPIFFESYVVLKHFRKEYSDSVLKCLQKTAIVVQARKSISGFSDIILSEPFRKFVTMKRNQINSFVNDRLNDVIVNIRRIKGPLRHILSKDLSELWRLQKVRTRSCSKIIDVEKILKLKLLGLRHPEILFLRSEEIIVIRGSYEKPVGKEVEKTYYRWKIKYEAYLHFLTHEEKKAFFGMRIDTMINILKEDYYYNIRVITEILTYDSKILQEHEEIRGLWILQTGVE